MTAWKDISVPEKPSPNYVVVKNISLQSSEKTVKEFFLFCGKIQAFEMQKDEDGTHQTALIQFERESAAKTAALLSNALIDESHITAAPLFETSTSPTPSSGDQEKGAEDHLPQESKSKSRIVAEILANGYMLQDQIVAKGIEYDRRYNVWARLSGYFTTIQDNVKQFDDKYRVWDKAVELDQKYSIQEKVMGAAQVAQAKAQVALNTTTGQKVQDLASHIAAVHYEAKRIQGEKTTVDTTVETTGETTVEPQATAVKPTA